MTRKPNPVAVAVEAQQSACRTLAEEIRAHAKDVRFWSKSEVPVMEHWADTLDSIAVAMGEAAETTTPAFFDGCGRQPFTMPCP